MKLRLSKLALVLVLALSLLSAGVLAEGGTVLYVDPAGQTIAPGASTTVEVWIGNVANFYGAQFELTFDDTVLGGVEVVEGAAFTAYPDEYEVAQSEIVSGTVRFAATLLRVPKAGPLDGDLHLATVTFAALGEGSSALSLVNVEVSDSYGQPIEVLTEDGSITVECETGVQGSASLEGREDHSGVLVTLENGAVLTATTDISGTYAFSGMAPGIYTVTLSHEGFLSVETGVLVSECETTVLCELTLLAGDLNGDGIIDIADLALCASNFGMAGPDGDVNGDGLVNIYDLVLVGKNFKLESPQLGACG